MEFFDIDIEQGIKKYIIEEETNVSEETLHAIEVGKLKRRLQLSVAFHI
jgi:hypothetical protein